MKKKCCMEDCNNIVDTEKDVLWKSDEEGYACESCMDSLGDDIN